MSLHKKSRDFQVDVAESLRLDTAKGVSVAVGKIPMKERRQSKGYRVVGVTEPKNGRKLVTIRVIR